MKYDAFDDWHPARRKPDNDSVDLPWSSKYKPKLFGRIHEWGEPHYVHVWKNGILDSLFDGLEEEIKRFNSKV